MHASTNRRVVSTTSLSLQPLEPRMPLAANVTTVVAVPAAKFVQTAAVELSSVRVQAVATPKVVVADVALVAAGKTAKAAAEAARAAAVAAEAGLPRADVAQAGADTLTAYQDKFSGVGRDTASDRPTAGLFGPDLSVGDRSNVIAEWRDKYPGMLGDGQTGAGRGAAPSSGGDDLRAAAAAGKGKASDETAGETSPGSVAQETIDKQRADDAALWGGFMEREWAEVRKLESERDSAFLNGALPPEADQQLWDAYEKAIEHHVSMYFSFYNQGYRCGPCKRPAPDDVGTQAGSATPPLQSPPPRPGTATRPAIDGGLAVVQTPGVVRGQVTTNPAVDRGRDYSAPGGTVPATPVTAAFARLNIVINWGNQR